MACAYLEGDRTITCAIKQQYAQTRRVFDLNALDGDFSSITDKRQNALNSSKLFLLEIFKLGSTGTNISHYLNGESVFVKSMLATL